MATIKSIEEKAKAYDKAIEKAKSKIKNDKDHVLYEDDIIEIFPVLKESEDERIRKILYGWVSIEPDDTFKEGFTKEQILSWLEKKGEQQLNGTFINADDGREEFTQEVYRILDADANNDRANQIIDTFDNLPTVAIEKQGEQKPAWNEEDEKMLNSFLHKLEVCDLLSNKEGLWIKNKLKALRPQSTWKPSDEQIEFLSDAIKHYNSLGYPVSKLKELMEDLEKLKG